MGRPSKLTDAQWEEIKGRVTKGEKPADLAREYKVSKAAVSNRVSKRIETIKTVANQMVSAEQALRSLPVSEQLITISLADDLRSISTHLAGAAKYGAATAHRLSGIANAEVQKIDDADPLSAQSVESLKGVSALTRLANEASVIGRDLLAANKDMTRKGEGGEPETPSGVLVVPGVLKDSTAWTALVNTQNA